MSCTRPVLRYFGGKWMLAPWVIRHFPPHRIYVEPFGGAASVLLRKPRCFAEVYNDLDDEVVNLFQVLRGPRAAELVEALILTPFSRTEFTLAKEHTDEPLERARRMVVRSFQGHGPDGAARGTRTGFRADNFASAKAAARDWSSYPEALKLVIARLDGVSIEKRPALELLRDIDRPEALFYVDPPYVWNTRTKRRGASGKPSNGYTYELTDDDHEELLAQLVEMRGMVVLSGYQNPLYERLLPGWERSEIAALADGARERRESLWLNPAAAGAHGLFAA